MSIENSMQAFETPSESANLGNDNQTMSEVMDEFDKAFGKNPSSERNATAGGGSGEKVTYLTHDDTMNEFQSNNQNDDSESFSDDEDEDIKKAKGDLAKLARIYQGRYDKTKSELERMKQSTQAQQNYVDFFNQLKTDEDIQRAFIKELNPELIKPVNPQSYVKDKLLEEFGKDGQPFQPVSDDRDDPTSETWQYYQRANELWQEAKQKAAGETPKALQELLEERRRQTEEANKQALEFKSNLLAQEKWDEARYNHYVGWVNNLFSNNDYLLKVYKFAHRNNRNATAPNLATTPGGSATKGDVFGLDKFFG